MKESDNYYPKQEDAIKETLISLKDIILAIDPDIYEVWQYRMPFFSYKKKRICYL